MDKQKLNEAIKDFKFYANPSNGNSSAPATIADIRKLIDETAKLAKRIADSLDD